VGDIETKRRRIKPERMPAKRKVRACCQLLPMALDRGRDTDHTGLIRGWTFEPGAVRDAIVLRVRKAADRTEPQAGVTLFAVSYCPFCGSDLRGKAERKP
jgi:hypothetical protein